MSNSTFSEPANSLGESDYRTYFGGQHHPHADRDMINANVEAIRARDKYADYPTQ